MEIDIEENKSRKRQRFLYDDQTNIDDEINDKKSEPSKMFVNLIDPEFEIPKEKPFIVRLNGVAFKNFVRDFAQPTDFLILEAMYLTLNDLTYKFNVTYGYTISDKIFLIFNKPPGNKHIYRGNVHKICSCLASYCAVRFIYYLQKIIRNEWFSNLQDYRSEQLKKMDESVGEHFKYFECKLMLLDMENLEDNMYIKLITKNFPENQEINLTEQNITNILNNSSVSLETREKDLKNIVCYGIFSKSVITQDITLIEVENVSSVDANFNIKLNPKTIKIINYILNSKSEIYEFLKTKQNK